MLTILGSKIGGRGLQRGVRLAAIAGVCAVAVAVLADEDIPTQAEWKSAPFVSPMFGDNMVLQRGKPNVIWGWCRPGDSVRVEITGQTNQTEAAPDGRWQLRIEPPSVGGPYTLTIAGSRTVTFTNILVGDVWLCGGQSNMELPLSRTRNGEEEIKAANHPNIRLFTVASQPLYSPAMTVRGSWKVCSPKTITDDGGFSAVGYYYALKLQSELGVPIGLIKDCIGGTPAESWTSIEALRTLKDFDAALTEVDRLKNNGAKLYGNYIMPWYDEFDVGQKGATWAAPALDDADWAAVTIPGGFKELGVADVSSVCYFRKTFVLPDPIPTGKATIYLGVIEKMDTAYINGRLVGASAWVENPRAYPVSQGILKSGTNVVTLRVFKVKPDGGFLSKPDELRLTVGETVIPLAGEWKGKLSVDARPPHPMPLGFENWPVMPAVLYNGMIAPVAPLSIAGAIWYQGEANTGRASQYRRLLPAMIADWRRAFGQGDFPFYIVSLAAYTQHKETPGDDWWAELRESQDLVARTVPNAALAVTIDVGDANDIHPKEKKAVGERLALCALAQHYGKKVVASGPTFTSVEELPGALKLHFRNADGGLVVKGDRLGEFSVAGADGHWVWAEARIEGDAVIVSSPIVPQPKAARYAWQANPTATLFNGAGLPAIPFRTDTAPGPTASR